MRAAAISKRLAVVVAAVLGLVVALAAPPAGAIEGGWYENSSIGDSSGRGTNVVQIYSRVNGNTPPHPLCSGGLIDQRKVVTSAHCVDMANERGEPELWVVANNIHRGQGKWIHVVEAEFSPVDQADLAVLTLDTDVGLPEDRLLHAYSYDQALPPIGQTMILRAFGTDAAGNPTPRLKGIEVKVVDNSSGVQDHMGGPAYRYEYLGGHACAGDSGGPVTVGSGGPEYLWGVHSMGTHYQFCGESYTEGMATDLTPGQLDWLRGHGLRAYDDGPGNGEIPVPGYEGAGLVAPGGSGGSLVPGGNGTNQFGGMLDPAVDPWSAPF